MPKSELDAARAAIDEVDQRILRALVERMEIAEQVARYKAEHEMPVLDEGREHIVIDSRVRMASEMGLPQGTAELYNVILSMSRARQEELLAQMAKERGGAERVAAFQGVPGANSHMALARLLGENTPTESFDTFKEVFEAVESGQAAYGVVPIENSYNGSVLEVYDLLGKYAVYIVGELCMPIHHSLMALPGTQLSDLKTVISHEQALGQCVPFFEAHPEIEPRPFYNTAGAAKAVSQGGDNQIGALANPYAAQLYGLEILISEVEASKDNTTRFLLLSARPYSGMDANKAAIRFTVGHAPGTLALALQHFASFGLNMDKIESRPVRDRNFEYAFYSDFEGDDVGTRVHRALEAGQAILSDVRVLGIYRN